jgi:4-aminobutyrate aminotransferase/(S)-3-amino-2-methylpropionate transaminase
MEFYSIVGEIAASTGSSSSPTKSNPALPALEKYFAIEHYGVEPDLITSAKSLGGGLPLAAVTGRAEIMDAAGVGGLGGTFGGNPLSCAAALAALDIIEKQGCLLAPRISAVNSKQRGKQWQKQFSIVGEVRGLGGMCAIELVKDAATREPHADATKKNRPILLRARASSPSLPAPMATSCASSSRSVVTGRTIRTKALDVLEAALAHVSAAAAPQKQLVTSNT